MSKKLGILRLFLREEVLTPSDLASLLGITSNYARQVILRLKRQGLIFRHPTFGGGQAYSLTAKGEARIVYLADKEKKETERKQREAIEQRKQIGMYLREVITEGLPQEIENRVRSEFKVSIERLGSKRLDEIALPRKIWEETGLLRLGRERNLEHLGLSFDAWVRVLQNISKPAPKPQHLSVEELLFVTALPKRGKGEFLVTEDGEVLYAPGKGYLAAEAAAVLAAYRKRKRTR
jgi:DNA-binding MarR family transcriptional regulator